MRITPKQLARILVENAQGKSGEELNKVVGAFVELLNEKKMLPAWRRVELEINSVWKELHGISRISVASAHALSDEVRGKLKQMAKGAEFIERVDDRLIGGAVVRLDDKLIDGTVAGALRRLKQTLQSAK